MAHDHDHRPPADLGPAFRWAVGLNTGYAIVEGVAGWITGSLALLADVAGLLIARGAAVLAKRAVTVRHSLGLRRATVLAALFNAVAILLGVVAVTWEAVQRLPSHQATRSRVVYVGRIGYAGNLSRV